MIINKKRGGKASSCAVGINLDDADLRVHLPLITNTDDVIGGYHGVIEGSVEFNGDGARIEDGTITISDVVIEENPIFLASLWVRCDDNTSRTDFFRIGGNNGTGDSYKAYLNRDSVQSVYVNYFEVGDDAEILDIDTAQFVHVVLSQDVDDTKRVYINGVLFHTTTGVSSLINKDIVLYATSGSASNISNFRFYDKDKSLDFICNLFAEGK